MLVYSGCTKTRTNFSFSTQQYGLFFLIKLDIIVGLYICLKEDKKIKITLYRIILLPYSGTNG